MTYFDFVRGGMGSGSPQHPRPVGPSIGTVTRVTAKGVFVVMDDFSDTHEWGPYPWNHAGLTPTAPAAGNKVVVVFIGNGVGRGFVVAWAPSVPWG